MPMILITFFLFVFTAEHCTSKYLLVEIDDNQGAVAEPWSRMTVQPPRCTFRNANEVCKGKEICIREKPGTEGFCMTIKHYIPICMKACKNLGGNNKKCKKECKCYGQCYKDGGTDADCWKCVLD